MSVSAHCFSQKKHLICLREFRKNIGYGRFEPKTTILAKESHDPFARIAVMPAKVKVKAKAKAKAKAKVNAKVKAIAIAKAKAKVKAKANIDVGLGSLFLAKETADLFARIQKNHRIRPF